MLKFENHLGKIEISKKYLIDLIGITVKECFGVVGIAPINAPSFINKIARTKNSYAGGIILKQNKDKFNIDLHIFVSYGTNVKTIVDSVSNKVRYVLNDTTELVVEKINVFVEQMK